MSVLILLLIFLFLVGAKTSSKDSPEPHFKAHLLIQSREYPDEFTGKFSYRKVGEYQESNTIQAIVLTNGFARATFSDTQLYDFDREQYKVVRISPVYSKYSF